MRLNETEEELHKGTTSNAAKKTRLCLNYAMAKDSNDNLKF